MPVTWPRNLVRQIASGRWILFIGAGVSATASNGGGQHPPTWDQLLLELSAELGEGERQEMAKQFIASGQLLRAADFIRWAYQDAARHEDYLAHIKRSIVGPDEDPFGPSDTHNQLLALNPSMVFTTNYDMLFEIASRNAYAAMTYRSPNIGSAVRRGSALYAKIHGDVSELEDLVLTRGDYVRVRREGSHALEVLRALFMTHTALFVGYSLRDPDVQLLLENVGPGTLNEEAHYLLSQPGLLDDEKQALARYYGVACLEYDESEDLHTVIETLNGYVEETLQQVGIGITGPAGDEGGDRARMAVSD